MSGFHAESGGHWYTVTGTAMHSVVGANAKERHTTLRDARKLNLLPSVTTILKVLDKPQLGRWKMQNAVVAAMTTPRLEGESDEAWCERILTVADSPMNEARDFGTALHDLMEVRAMRPDALSHPTVDPALKPWFPFIEDFYTDVKEVVLCESAIVGEGYAGRIDLLARHHSIEGLVLSDFKTSKWKTGKAGFYDDHARQLAAYATVLEEQYGEVVTTRNVGINSLRAEAFQYRTWTPEERASAGLIFKQTLKLWQSITGYRPQQTTTVNDGNN